MPLSTVYLRKNGIIVYKANAGFGVSTVDETYARARLDVPLCRQLQIHFLRGLGIDLSYSHPPSNGV